MPNVTIRQIPWSASKSKLIGDSNTQANNRSHILRYIEVRSSEFDSVLVLCQMDLERQLRDQGLPDHVQTGHFNNLRGIDKYKDVECLIVIGRSQPPPDQAEIRSEVLFDRVPVRGRDWTETYYPKREVGISVRGQFGRIAVEAEYHPDPDAEIVRWSICEAELIQSIGRGRGVNRTSQNPLQIDIIGTVPLPIEVDEVLRWKDAQADPFELMRARGIVMACRSTTRGFWHIVAAVLPDMFKDKQAAQDRSRSLTMESANKLYLISESHRESMISAKVRLAGTRYAVPILIDPHGKDPKEFAIGILGALDFFEIDGFPSTGPVYIHPTFIDEPVQPRPENPHPPALIASSPDPDPMPEPGSFEIEEVYRGAPEKIYQQAVASMDDNDWLDLDVAGVEAARRWFVAMQPHDTDELTTTA
jgi:hypothetical protein